MPSFSGTLLVQDSQIYGNTVDGTGGGLFVQGNNALQWTCQRTSIYSNTAAAGGGIGNFVPLTLSDSSIHDNHVTFDGGGAEVSAPIIIQRSTIANNSAARFGGGIFSLQTSANPSFPEFCRIEASTLNGNFALDGGAVYHDGFITPGSLLHIINSTIYNNAVSKNGQGGGLFLYLGQTQLVNSTVAFNHVVLSFPPNAGTGIGGGLYIRGQASDSNTFVAQNSIISNNYRGNGIQLDTADDGYTTMDGTTNSSVNGSLSFNLIKTTTNFFITGPQGGEITGQDPFLGPLQDNGGPTYTVELLSGSPAINTGSDVVLNAPFSLTTDQRGYPRKIGTHVDMGALEYEAGGALRIISTARNGSGYVVTFQALQGSTYRLYRTLTLTNPNWQTIPGVADFTAAGTGPAVITDPTASSFTKAYYHVQLLH